MLGVATGACVVLALVFVVNMFFPDSQLAQAAGGTGEGTASQSVATPAGDAGRVHEVRRGDTLSRIAARYGVPLRALFEINGLTGRSILRPGQVIRIDP